MNEATPRQTGTSLSPHSNSRREGFLHLICKECGVHRVSTQSQSLELLAAQVETFESQCNASLLIHLPRSKLKFHCFWSSCQNPSVSRFLRPLLIQTGKILQLLCGNAIFSQSRPCSRPCGLSSDVSTSGAWREQGALRALASPYGVVKVKSLEGLYPAGC